MKNGRMDIMKKRGLKKFAAGVTLLLALGLLAGCGGEKKEAGSAVKRRYCTTGRTQCA